jgi:hypothetical protein
VPDSLVKACGSVGTRRVAGTLEGVDVNLALTRAPVYAGTFAWTGASLLRRMRVEVGDPVTGFLAPVDPDHVPLPPDVVGRLTETGMRDTWEALSPGTRRRLLVPVDGAATEKTRARRVQALLTELGWSAN